MFRHNLTQLKDSLSAGQAYEVIDRGKTLAFFIPSDYKIEIEVIKKPDINYLKILNDAIGCVQMSEKKKKNFDYKIEYRKALEKEYLK